MQNQYLKTQKKDGTLTDALDTPTVLQQDLQTALRQGLDEQGMEAPAVTQQQLKNLASTMARLLARRIGGRYVAFVEDRARRDSAVLAAWNGRNREVVMKKFGISRALFYNILARHGRNGQSL